VGYVRADLHEELLKAADELANAAEDVDRVNYKNDELVAAIIELLKGAAAPLEWRLAYDHWEANTALGSYEVGDAGGNTAFVSFPHEGARKTIRVSPFDEGRAVAEAIHTRAQIIAAQRVKCNDNGQFEAAAFCKNLLVYIDALKSTTPAPLFVSSRSIQMDAPSEDWQEHADKASAIIRGSAQREVTVQEAVLSLIPMLHEKHIAFYEAKGRDPKDYTSKFSVAADTIRTLVKEGQSDD
jgi:hypothetical protein